MKHDIAVALAIGGGALLFLIAAVAGVCIVFAPPKPPKRTP
jgi:hypothetical protein